MKTIQKKEYVSPEIEVCDFGLDECIMDQYSFGVGGDDEDEAGAKGGLFEFEDDDDDWNGWN